tara:strand:- start:501 stop:1154 length:654 start_codon:yes stop_codon:yes gene_type:complete
MGYKMKGFSGFKPNTQNSSPIKQDIVGEIGGWLSDELTLNPNKIDWGRTAKSAWNLANPVKKGKWVWSALKGGYRFVTGASSTLTSGHQASQGDLGITYNDYLPGGRLNPSDNLATHHYTPDQRLYTQDFNLEGYKDDISLKNIGSNVGKAAKWTGKNVLIPGMKGGGIAAAILAAIKAMQTEQDYKKHSKDVETHEKETDSDMNRPGVEQDSIGTK